MAINSIKLSYPSNQLFDEWAVHCGVLAERNRLKYEHLFGNRSESSAITRLHTARLSQDCCCQTGQLF